MRISDWSSDVCSSDLQCDLGTGHRHVGAGAHGDADVGTGESGRIVDAVAGHRHRAALGLESLHQRDLVGRAYFAMDLVDAELTRHRIGGAQTINGGHHDAQTGGMPSRDRSRRGGLARENGRASWKAKVCTYV